MYIYIFLYKSNQLNLKYENYLGHRNLIKKIMTNLISNVKDEIYVMNLDID